MGCGSSKGSDVTQPGPVQSETVVNGKNDFKSTATKDAGENGGLDRRDITKANNDTKHIHDDNVVIVDNSDDNNYDVSGTRDDYKVAYVDVGLTDDTQERKASNTGSTATKNGSKPTTGKILLISTNKKVSDVNSTTNNVDNSGENNYDVSGTRDDHKFGYVDVGLTDDTQERKASNTGSTATKNGNKPTTAKILLKTTNKKVSDVNSTTNNDKSQKKVVAGDTQKAKASGTDTLSNKQTGRKSTNAKSSIKPANKSDPANSVKKPIAKEANQRGGKRSVISQPKWRHDYDIPVVDPEEGLVDLPDIYKGMEQPIKIEDTFWSGKRKVIPDFQVMRDIDKHALAAPQNMKTDLELLVKYLVKPAKNEIEMYRAIARWIGQNIAYDTDAYFSGQPTRSPSDPQGILAKGSAICSGYSKLFQAMCKDAGLECDVISGKAKGVGYSPGSDGYENHAWNKIMIENEPYICDATWGAGGVGADKKFKRLWKEHEFLSEPVSFSRSRLPVDLQNNSEVNESAQLCEKPFKSLKTWADLPHYGSMLQAAGATVSPNKGTIEAKANEGEVRINIPRLLEVYTTLKEKSKSADLKGNHVMILWEGDTAVLRFALPGPGKFQLSVTARFSSAADKETEQLFGNLVTYCINATGTQHHQPFPLEHGYYGNSPYIFLKGYQCLSHDQPIIETNSHRLIMQFACPDRGKAFFKLLDSSKKKPKEETAIENSLYVDKFPNKYACYIFLPKPGNYLLKWLTITEPGKDTYQVRATYILKFKGKLPSITSPFAKHNDWGARKIFHDSKFKLMNIHGSTIRLNGGEGLLSFCRPSDCKKEILTNVVTMRDTNPPDSRDWTIITKDKITSDTEQVNVTIVLPKAGFFGLNLFIDRQFAGRFLISSDAKVKRSHPEKG